MRCTKPRRCWSDVTHASSQLRKQSGQAVVIIAFMLVVLIGLIGLAVDGGIGYYYNNLAERAAGAAALSGVVFMPGQFTPSQAIPARWSKRARTASTPTARYRAPEGPAQRRVRVASS